MIRRSTTSALVALLLTAPQAFAQDDLPLTVAAQFEIQSAEPSTSGYVFTRMGITETLVNADAEGRLTPGLATGWEVSGDNLTWRFTLREDVVFHDGTPMDAGAVVNALTIARDKPGSLAELPIEQIAAEDGTVVVRLSDPRAALPAYLAEFRAQIMAPAAYAEDGQAREVIGTGPYRVTTFAPPLSLDATAFDDYWGAPPFIADVAYDAVSRVETRALMAQSGDADFVFGLDPASVARLDTSDTVEVHSVAIPRTLLLKVNAGHPALSDPKARQALSLAIDREGIAQAILRYPEGADQLFPPSVGAWHNDDIDPLDYDPDAASQMLSDLGWNAGADGILKRNGERFALALTTYPDRPELPLVSAILEQQFRQIGVELTINSTNSSEIPAGHQDGSLDLGLIARNFSLIPDPIGTVMSDYAPTGDWGAMNWENPAFVDLVDGIARSGGTDTDRAEAVRILQADLPVIPIAWYRQTLAAASDLEGVTIDPFERSFGLQYLKRAR